MTNLETYLERFAKLRSDYKRSYWPTTTYYRAPHKPLLLLAVMDSIAEGTVSANLIEVTPDLGELFSLYWSRVMPPDQQGNLALPFFHLRRDGFWHLLPQPGKEAIVAAISQIRYVNQLRELVIGAQLDEELYQLLRDENSRERLRALVIETYFAPELRPGLMVKGSSILKPTATAKVCSNKPRDKKTKNDLRLSQRYVQRHVIKGSVGRL